MNIIIVDDDKLVCSALKTILESEPDFHVPAMGHNGNEAISLYKSHHPDLILMDIRMGELTGIDAGESILKEFPDAKILYLTTFADNEYIVKALRIGAKGYLLKQNFESIIPAIKAVSSGQNVFGDEIVSKLPNMSWSSKPSLSGYNLTDRELDIISNVAEGLSNKEIANLLFLSEGTVRNYISTILEKLNLRDRTQLAIFYYKHQS
ncbi:MAG: response regulator transcription factor [Lachnospiraceae bacterium]|mgnify:CR=1 FL=1|nr:response regulator transcription factor [Lachnospiraceae bacterium]